MRHLYLAAGFAAALFASPLTVFAQDATATGAATGAIGGAIVGGPVGAVVGGVLGASVGAVNEDPDFRAAPVYTYSEPVVVGSTLPAESVTYYRPARTIVASAPAKYSYVRLSNGQWAVVDTSTRAVVEIH